MRNSTPQARSSTGRQITTIFTSGNSQAVRLPKAFRFDSKTVEIERRGDEIVLRAKKQTVGDILAQLPQFNAKAGADWEHVDALLQDEPPQQRDWNALLEPTQQAQVSAAKKRRTAKKSTAA